MSISTRTGPARDLVFLFAACLNRGHFGPSAIARVEPDEAVMVGPIEAVIAIVPHEEHQGLKLVVRRR